MILIYLLIAARGFKIALLASDGFSKLLATGLTAVFAIQAFVIIGGVTRVIPLTGVTLPFISYGGSSIVANFVLLALLLLISDRARREAAEPAGRMAWRWGRRVNRQIVKLFAFIVVLFGVLVGFTSYWSVFDAKALKEKDANKRPLLEQQQIRRGRILAADGTVIAKSVAKGKGDAKRYVRRYPEGSLFGHPIGYSFVRSTATASSSSSTTTNWSAKTPNSARSSTSCSAAPRKATTSSPTSTPKRSGWRSSELEEAGFGAVVAIEPEHRRGQGDGLQRALRPEPGPLRPRKAELERDRNAAAEPGDAGPLPAGLDLQGGDRRGGPRERRDHAGNDDRRARLARSRRARRWKTTSTRTSAPPSTPR